MGDSSSDEDEVEYELEDFVIGGMTFSLTTIAYMPITQLMKMNETKTEISGQKLWCGSLVVMEYLLANANFVTSATVIELGAGTGVTGMLCKKLGCHTAFLTDHDQRSIDHMLLDIARNGIDCSVVPLDWFSYDARETLRLLRPEASTSSPLRIVAGDVLYKHELIAPFFAVITSLLTACAGSEMLLCHVPRAGVEQQQVVNTCEQHGLSVCRVEHEQWKRGVVVEYSTPDDFDRAELYLIRRGGGVGGAGDI